MLEAAEGAVNEHDSNTSECSEGFRKFQMKLLMIVGWPLDHAVASLLLRVSEDFHSLLPMIIRGLIKGFIAQLVAVTANDEIKALDNPSYAR